MIFKFISQNTEFWTISFMCEVLEVSQAGYFRYIKNKISKMQKKRLYLLKIIEVEFNMNNQIYGSRRIHKSLVKKGIR